MQQRIWRGLITAFAISVATKLFGVIGCIVVATILAILWRRPKPQIITASVFAGVGFVAIMLLQGYPPAPLIATPATSNTQAVTVPQQPTNPSSTDWNRVASTFEATHPDLKYGRNTQIMQSKINALAGGRLNNEGILDMAYATAKLDSGWTTTAAGPSEATSEQARWDTDVRAFIATHPDLNFGSNLRVMDGYARIMMNGSGRNYNNATILNSAYAAARLDPHWSFITAASAPNNQSSR